MDRDPYRYLKSDTSTKEEVMSNDRTELDLSAWDLPSDGSDQPHVVKFYTTSISGDIHSHKILFKTKLDADLCAEVLRAGDNGDHAPHTPEDVTVERYLEESLTFNEWKAEYKK